MSTTFYYKARTPEGDLVNGSMLAENSEEIVAHLRTRALFITSIAEASTLTGRIESVRTWGPVSPPPLVTFFRSFVTLVRAGVSISRSLTVTIAQCPDARLREALRAVLAEIEQGRSLSSAMRRHPRAFAPLYVAMVEAGEAGGMLDDVLDRLAAMLEKDAAMRKKVSAAFAYPTIVLASAIGLIFFLLSTIVPTFGRFFSQLNVEQPRSTRVLLFIGTVTAQPLFWGSLLVLLISAACFLLIARRDSAFAAALDTARLRFPIIGTLHRKSVIARLARMLGSLLRSGVDVLRSIEVAAPVTGNAAYAKALHDLHSALREGDSIAEQLERSTIFEPMVLQMVRVGEETGTLDSMLLKTAEYYEGDVESAMATLSTTIEPMLILLVGGIVGFIVFSVFVPMYSLVSQIR